MSTTTNYTATRGEWTELADGQSTVRVTPKDGSSCQVYVGASAPAATVTASHTARGDTPVVLTGLEATDKVYGKASYEACKVAVTASA